MGCDLPGFVRRAIRIFGPDHLDHLFNKLAVVLPARRSLAERIDDFSELDPELAATIRYVLQHPWVATNADPIWPIRVVAVALVLFSAGTFLIAAWRYAHLGIKLQALDVRLIPTRLTTAMGLLMAVCALLSLLALLLSGG